MQSRTSIVYLLCWKEGFTLLSSIFFILFSLSCTHKEPNSLDREDIIWKEEPVVLPKTPIAQKPKILWIDAVANFQYLANNQENVSKYLDLAKESGFTEVVLDVRPASGDVLYNSNIAAPVKKLGSIERTESWDYLGTFIQQAHSKELKINANISVMLGGTTRDGGILFREKEKADWATSMYYESGVTSIMNDPKSDLKFFNPINLEVQNYILSIVTELATKYPTLDGIVYDYGRYTNLHSDFSVLSKNEFEKHIGKTVNNFPLDILTWSGNTPRPGQYYKKWLEFRAKVIYDLFDKTKTKIKSINPNIKFGTYTGSWYSSYYELGVNWASKKYATSTHYPQWATPEYKNYGYAGLLDFYMTGAYGETLYGKSSEWTVEGGILKAQEVVMGDVRVIGGLYGLNYHQKPQKCEEAVFIALTTGDGLMFFDMIYLIMYNQWDAVKRGIDRALKSDK